VTWSSLVKTVTVCTNEELPSFIYSLFTNQALFGVSAPLQLQSVVLKTTCEAFVA
jgi:hypothetical protein